jgi:hypothetical protein
MQGESIYNLIPKEYVQPPKQPLYKSKHKPDTAPTASTIGHHTTSIPGTSNLAGGKQNPHLAHGNKNPGATFGTAKGVLKPDTQNFTKKGTGKMGSIYQSSEDGGNFKYEDSYKKPTVPKKDEKPIMGLVSQKNYVIANAVENMLAQPKLQEDPKQYTKKQEYGKTPEYLKNIKEEMNREYDHIKHLHQQEEQELANEKFLLSEEEVKVLRQGLKRKWEMVNKEYQQITHISKIDTVGLKRTKEDCEKELAQLEKDIAKLNKAFIFVDTTS